MVWGLVSGARNPIRIEPEPSPRICCGSGGAIVTTTSEPHTSEASGVIRAPASTKAASGSRASAPAPSCTTTSRPLAFSLLTTSGTSATRCSPAAVSFGTPIRMCRAGTYPIAPIGGAPGMQDSISSDRQPHPHLHEARRRRRDPPRRHESRVQAAPPRRGLRDGRRAERHDRGGPASARPSRGASPGGCAACRTTCSTSAPTCRCRVR